MSNSTYKPSFVLTKLYRKKSEKGTSYFSGRLGGARVALLKSNDTADDGAEIWTLLVSEAPKRENNGEPLRAHDASADNPRQPVAAAVKPWQWPDDEIAF